MPRTSGGGGYRRNDPNTSRDAAEKIKAKAERDVIITLKTRGTVSTCHEIANDLGGVHHYSTVTPRMKPLEERGEIKRFGKKHSLNGKGRDSNQIAWGLPEWEVLA